MKLDLDLLGDPPDGWSPLEAVVVVKYLDETGDTQLHATTTEAVSGWEVAGMLIWALDSARGALQEGSRE